MSWIRQGHRISQHRGAAKRIKVVFCRVLRVPGTGMEVSIEFKEVPGMGMEVLQHLHNFRARVWISYRTHASSGYGYESLTELTQVPGTGMEVLQNSQMFPALVRKS